MRFQPQTLCALPLAVLLAACTAARAPRTSTAEDDFAAEILEASTRRPPEPERISEHRPVRVRSRGLARIDLPAVEVELAVRALDARGVPARCSRLRLVRFPDVVHLASLDGGDEWSFARNPVATDEVSGVRVDHGSRFLIDCTDSELASEGVLDGWARLAQLFVSPEDLDGLRSTGETSSWAGFAFERRVRAGDAAVGELIEVEWSRELGLPRRAAWRTAGGERVQELVALRIAGDADRPADLAARWPDYARKDLSDWREDVHGVAHGGHEH